MSTVGIVGVSGYSGMELARIVAGHPRLALALAISDKWAGSTLGDAGAGSTLGPPRVRVGRSSAAGLIMPDGRPPAIRPACGMAAAARGAPVTPAGTGAGGGDGAGPGIAPVATAAPGPGIVRAAAGGAAVRT